MNASMRMGPKGDSSDALRLKYLDVKLTEKKVIKILFCDFRIEIEASVDIESPLALGGYE